MADATPSRLGQVNAAGDALALFITKMMGEVLTSFNENNVMLARTLVRTIDQGKSATFPATWKADSTYHIPGNELLGTQKVRANQRVINIDGVVVADAFIASIDEAMNHYDVRSIYSSALGEALARRIDTNLLRLAVLAARTSAKLFGNDALQAAKLGGTALSDASMASDKDVLAAHIFDANQTLDEKDVPKNDRFCAVKPAQYYLLVQSTTLQNTQIGGAGAYLRGTIPFVCDTEIVKSNNLPSTNITEATAGENNTYYGNFTKTVAAVWQRSAIATVKLRDLAFEQEYQISRQGTLMVAKYAMGHGILRPECAVELATT